MKGKNTSKMNAYKNGWHMAEVKAVKRQFAEYDRQLDTIKDIIDDVFQLQNQFRNNTNPS